MANLARNFATQAAAGDTALYCSALNALAPTYTGEVVTCSGYSAQSDGGGGTFVGDVASSTTIDNATVFGSGSYRWKRVYTGPIQQAWYGTITAAKINALIAIQNALGGGTVSIPKSAMTITGVGADRILPLSNVRLVFEPGCTITTGVWTASSEVISITTTTSAKENIRVEGNGCVITCDRTGATAERAGYGITVNVQTAGDVCRDIYVSDFKIINTTSDAITVGGNAGTYCERVAFERIWTYNCYRNGGSVIGGCRGLRVIDCTFERSNGSTIEAGFDIEIDNILGADYGTGCDIELIRCVSKGNYGNGFYLQGNYTGAVSRVKLTDCVAKDNKRRGFISTIYGLILDGCEAYRNGAGYHLERESVALRCLAQDSKNYSTTPATTVLGFSLYEGSTATKCTSRWNGGDGFTMSQPSRGTTGPTMTDCTSLGNLDRGINVSYAKNARVIGCTVVGNGTDGVRLGSSHHCGVTGNFIAGNGQLTTASYDNVIVEGKSTLNSIGGNNILRMSPTFQRGLAVVDATYTTTTRVKLASTASSIDDDYIGMFVRITAGTSSGAYGMITDYDGTLQYCTVYWSSATLLAIAPLAGAVAGALAAAPAGDSMIEIVGGRLFTGTIESATSTTATLMEDLASHSNDIFNGCLMTIVSGTGANAANATRLISDYDGATQTATLSAAWTTTPDNTSVIEIIGVQRPRYGMRITADCSLNRIYDNDGYYSGTTGNISDGGSSDTTVNRST